MIEFVQLADIPQQLNQSVTATTSAINAVKAAWESWAWILPLATTIITQASALVQGVNAIPGVKWIAGNYGHATNAK